MPAAVNKVLIVGGGMAGMAAAIGLRAHDVAVDLLELDEHWRPVGAGISVNGAMLRALEKLGLLDGFLEEGNAGDGIVVHAPDGKILGTQPTPSVGGKGIPGQGGIMRSALAQIMADKTRASGARAVLGQTYRNIEPDADGVWVETATGRGRYDLVIIADGLYSKTREQFFPRAPQPRYVGQAVWRAVLPRPAGIDTTHIWLGIKGIKPGVNPVSKDQVYMFISEDVPMRAHLEPAVFRTRMKDMLNLFSCPLIKQFRDQIGDESQIIYRPLESLLMREAWHQGRIVMIGDTVHATTPQLTAGAMMGVEDGIVLAEELGKGGDLEGALTRFFDRRFDRCRMVVQNSGRLGEIEVTGGSEEEYQRILRESGAALAQPF